MSGSTARRRARSRRTVRRSLLAVLVLAVTVGVVYAGIRDRSGRAPGASMPSAGESAAPAPSSRVDLSALPIARGDFCELLHPGDVADALGASVSDTRHYRVGDRVLLAPGLTDVSHEYGCTFAAANGAEARVWVFAEPVTRGEARTIVRDARREKGCSERPDAPTFGTPSVGTFCRTSRPASRSVTLRGLFGDAWLSCRLSTPGVDTGTVQRADQWCVRVATTLGARP
jgi:hypothetical protein